jgi:hypothetical protein
VIKKQGKKWVLMDKAGKKVLGRHDSKGAAVRQEQAIEIAKKKRG